MGLTRASRVAKRDSSARSASSKNRRACQVARRVGSLSGSEGGALRDMLPDVADAGVQEKEDTAMLDDDGSTQVIDKGKGKARVDDEEVEEVKEKECFRLMDLPAELRLHIYRACLTRPYNVLLSKVEPPPARAASSRKSNGQERAMRAVAWQRDGQEAGGWNLVGGGQQSDTRPRRSRLRRVFSASNTLDPVDQNVQSRAEPSRSKSSLSDGSMDDAEADLISFGTAQQQQREPVAVTKRNYASPTDPLIINVLRTSKQVYKEARDVLYSENVFTVQLETAVATLACLHQRSRRHIKNVEVVIPTYTEIIERFSEVVRLSLRYCSGLRRFTVYTPFTLPGAEGGMGSNGTVYANGFDILRWLPQHCEVLLAGVRNPEIDVVVGRHLMLAKAQDKVSWSNEQFRYTGGGSVRMIE